MRYVVAVAETGGFTRAAGRCHVVQSALSHQIGRLEKELGARLFERTSRSVRLTAAGEAFLPVARQALDVLGHDFGDSRLIGGWPSSAVCRRRVL
ncbi:regulatory helix-turn-helix protein, lysR family [Streptomyces sp. 2314.4]|nr:regulatory helix-turn-helix protein, lysR family [Streptomyces sp. 2314.4]